MTTKPRGAAAPDPMRRAAAIGLIIGAAVILFLQAGRRQSHHWDEPVYLYAAAHYTPKALAGGSFEPGNIPGFFSVKIGHVTILHWMIRLFGQGLHAVVVIQCIYTMLVLLTCGLVGWWSWLTWRNLHHAIAVGLVALVTPVSIYLGPKLLSEVPAMFCGMGSLVALGLALRSTRRIPSALWTLIGGAALAGAVLCRETAPLLVATGWGALFIAAPRGVARRRILLECSLIAGCAVVLLGVAQWVLHLDFLHALRSAHALAVMDTPLRQWLKRIVFAFGPLLAVAPFAAFSTRRREAWFYGLWLAGSVLPLLLSLRYLEERFLVTGVPALAGLAVLGGEVLWQWMGRSAAQILGIGLLAMVAMRANAIIQPRTFYSVDEVAYEEVMDWLGHQPGNRPILIPWVIGDYHYLRVAYPDAPVYLVDTESLFVASATRDDIAQGRAQRFGDTMVRRVEVDPRQWYGTRYIPDLKALQALGPAPWWYVTTKVRGRDKTDYSWIWTDPGLELTLVFDNGQYYVYKVVATGRG